MRNARLLLLLFVGIIPVTLYAQAGNTGLSFLKNGVGARNAAMGEAGAATALEGASLYYNPAGIGDESRPSIFLSHSQSYQDLSAQYLGIVLPGKGWAFGAHVGVSSVSGIEIRTVPGVSEGTFSAKDFTFGLTASIALTSAIDLGITGKLLYEKIYVDDATGYALDFGVRLRPFQEGDLKSLRLGASLANVGSMSEFRTEAPTLPVLLRAGAAYTYAVPTMRSAFTVAMDAVKVTSGADGNVTAGQSGVAQSGENMHLHAGLEGCYDDMVSLRAGYQSGYDFKGFTAGLGFSYSVLRFDYALLPHTNNFGTGHLFSFSILF
jgi:hypothetical protein